VLCYTSAIYDGAICPSVRLTQADIVQKWLNLGSRKQHCTIAQRLWFFEAKYLREIRLPLPPTETPDACGVS